jgi:polar amino acid transport system substrate-binding protein
MFRSAHLSPKRGGSALAAAAVVAALAACAPADSASTTTSSAAGSAGASSAASASPSAGLTGACAKDQLKLKTAGTLTVGTDKPAYTPWFVDDTPSNGKGFESAVAYAIADKLGFAPTEVSWTVVKFDALFSPKATPFDLDLNQVSIQDDRKKVVDFSSGYYDVTQAIVTTKTSKIAGAKSLADLKGAKLGAQRGTTSYQSILDQIKPTNAPAVYPSNDNAKLALSNGQIDGLVVDLPTALYIAGAELKDGAVIGQLENVGGTPEQFGAVIDKGSALTPCVTQAVDALRTDGTLKKLADQWLTTTDGAPVLK